MNSATIADGSLAQLLHEPVEGTYALWRLRREATTGWVQFAGALWVVGETPIPGVPQFSPRLEATWTNNRSLLTLSLGWHHDENLRGLPPRQIELGLGNRVWNLVFAVAPQFPTMDMEGWLRIPDGDLAGDAMEKRWRTLREVMGLVPSVHWVQHDHPVESDYKDSDGCLACAVRFAGIEMGCPLCSGDSRRVGRHHCQLCGDRQLLVRVSIPEPNWQRLVTSVQQTLSREPRT